VILGEHCATAVAAGRLAFVPPVTVPVAVDDSKPALLAPVLRGGYSAAGTCSREAMGPASCRHDAGSSIGGSANSNGGASAWSACRAYNSPPGGLRSSPSLSRTSLCASTANGGGPSVASLTPPSTAGWAPGERECSRARTVRERGGGDAGNKVCKSYKNRPGSIRH